MLKNASESLVQPAQPLLRGINLAKFLRNGGPSNKRQSDSQLENGRCSGLPLVRQRQGAQIVSDVENIEPSRVPGSL